MHGPEPALGEPARMLVGTRRLRFQTKGGAAPAGTCTPDAMLDVDYSATHAFYEAAPAK
jgi:hypothetical protein